MKLSDCPSAAQVRLVRFDVAPQFQLRLHELGLRPSAIFTTVTRAAFGGVVINVAGSRIAVDRRSARQMEVELVA